VAEYLRRAQEAGLKWPLPADMGEDRLYRLLFPKAPSPGSRVIPCPDWSLVHTELHKKSVTLRLLWVEYREAHPDGYGYSQFCALYQAWAKRLKPSMRLFHKGGEKVFVDYAGQTVPVTDPHTAQVLQAQVFIGVLGASNYILRLRSGQALRRGPGEPGSVQLNQRPRSYVRLFRRCAGNRRSG